MNDAPGPHGRRGGAWILDERRDPLRLDRKPVVLTIAATVLAAAATAFVAGRAVGVAPVFEAAALACMLGLVVLLALRASQLSRRVIRQRALSTDTAEIVFVIGGPAADPRIIDVVGTSTAVLGFDPSLTIGLDPAVALRTPTPERVGDAIALAVGNRDKPVRVEALVVGVDTPHGGRDLAASHYVDLVARDLAGDPAVRALALTVSDATDRVHAQRALYDVSGVDPETHLPNRTRFVELAELSLHRARRNKEHVALLTVGIDRFDALIDGFDDAGRRTLLVEAARRVRATVRLDDPVGRVAPDCLAVVLGGLDPGIGRAYAVDVADRLLTALAMPFSIDASRLELSVSIGVAHREPLPDTGASGRALIEESECSLRDVQANTNRWKDQSPPEPTGQRGN